MAIWGRSVPFRTLIFGRKVVAPTSAPTIKVVVAGVETDATAYYYNGSSELLATAVERVP